MPDLIPAARLTDWTPGTRTGVPGGIPTTRTNTINVTQAPYNADNTGVSDASTAIQSAIDASSVDDIIYLPTGSYKLTAGLSFSFSKDSRTIRGDGPTATILLPTGGAAAIYGGGSDGWSWPSPAASVTAGLAKDSTSITLDDATEFAVGALIMVGFANQLDNTAITAGAVPIVSTSGYDLVSGQPMRRQVSRVTAKVGNVLTISPGIYHDANDGLAADAWVAQLQLNAAGIEDLAVNMENSTAAFPIQFEHAYGCWVKNVKVTNPSNYGIYISDSLQCEVRECEIRDRKVGGNNGAGLLANTVAGCLFEDNIFYNVFPNLEMNHGSCGCVFGYNLCENPPDGGFIYFAIDTNHGPHNSFNLYEGNVSPNIISDGYFGSESEGLAYRNWLHGSCEDSSATTYTAALKRFTRNFSFAGNVVGKTSVAEGGFSYGQPNIGNGDSTGTAEPTTGDFWADWKATATLTTRTSDTAGTITLASGSIVEGQLITIRWNSGANSQNFTAGVVTGNSVPWTGGSGNNLPAQGTALTVFMGPGGYQELDLDVENSAIDKGNYIYGASGAAGSMTGLDGGVLIDSYYRGSKPSWFYSLSWPPFDPNLPNSSAYGDIPAGYRFLNNGDDPPAAGGSTITVANVTNFNIL